MRNQTFIQAGTADLERVLAFIKAYYDFDGIPFKACEIKRSLHALLENSSLGQVWLIHRNAKDVGYAVITVGYDLEFGGQHATITELYITAPYRRLGLGTKTIRFLEATCRESGIEALELQVERDNTEARAFYRKLGFTAHDRIPLSKLLNPAAISHRKNSRPFQGGAPPRRKPARLL